MKKLFEDADNIGSVKWIEGKPYFLFDSSSEGFIFKDYKAYEDDWDASCFVPEYAAEDAAVTIGGVEYECGGDKEHCDWYSHNDLLELCYGNHQLCDYLFGELDWTYPSTFLDEMETRSNPFFSFWGFVKPGARVWWNDPQQYSCGWYTVDSAPEYRDDNEEEWFDEAIINISADHGSQAEVFLCELSQHPYKLNIPEE